MNEYLHVIRQLQRMQEDYNLGSPDTSYDFNESTKDMKLLLGEIEWALHK